jgi:PAS domain S-box-containing protein
MNDPLPTQIGLAEPARMGEALLQTRERLQLLISSTAAVLYSCSVTPPYGATFVGENVKRQLGYEPEEFTEDPGFWAAHVHPDDAPHVLASVGRLTQVGEEVLRYRFQHKDGTYRWMRDDLRLVRDANGEPREILGCWIDITDAKRAEQELRKHAELLDLTPDAIIVCAMDGRITSWNRGAQTFYGWTESQALGQTPHKLLRTRFPQALAEIKTQLHTCGHWEGELAQTTRDGHKVVVASRWSLQLDTDGSPLAILETNSDITELKQAEEALRLAQVSLEQRVQERTAMLEAANQALLESQERFRQVAENIPDVFWLSNPSMTQLIYVSPAYEEIWGRTCRELYENPQGWLEALHPEDQARLREFLQTPQAEAGFEFEYRVIRPDGSVRWVLDHGFPVRDPSGAICRFAGIARDITERKELEREILGISEREQRRIGQDLHDDLCQQLAGIEFLCNALEQQIEGQPLAARAREIGALIRGAIDHSRRLARGLAPVELEAEGLMQALAELARQTSTVFRIRCSFDCPAPVLMSNLGVSTHLYRIAQEAVTNSVKHGKAKQIQIRLANTDGRVCLSVTDNGSGLADKSRHGPGMGLRVMQHRASTIGATLVLQRRPGGGTTVVCTVQLPVSTAANPPES